MMMKKSAILVFGLFLANSFVFSQITRETKGVEKSISIQYDSTSPDEIWEIQKEGYEKELKALGLSAQEIEVKMKIYLKNKKEVLKDILKQRELAEVRREKAEIERGKAKKRRDSAEVSREKAEIERGKAKKRRDSAEVSREKAEIERGKAEKRRDSAEVSREKAEIEREKAKKRRDSAEVLREKAAIAREKAEVLKDNN